MSTRPPGPISLPKGKEWQILSAGDGFLSAICGESSNVEPGIWGSNDLNGDGTLGTSASGTGVHGSTMSPNGYGVLGENTAPAGAGSGNGVTGFCNQSAGSGVWGNNTGGGSGISGSSNHTGVYGTGPVWAGLFDGHVHYNKGYMMCGNPKVDNPVAGHFYAEGDCHVNNVFAAQDVLLGADCAEDFDIKGSGGDIEPGTVMVADQEGLLRQSTQAYDRKAVGVISGAGDWKPGIILDRKSCTSDRRPIALVGKVYCKVDAQYAAVEVGDLLTTSPTPGYAMKAVDPLKAFGAVMGKALRRLEVGQGLIPILIALQ